MKKRIGILGGTFDPIHNAHLFIAEAAAKELRLSKVLLMPSKTPAYKLQKGGITDEKHRAKMTELACEGRKKLVFSDLELQREGNTYTADTLKILKEMMPDAELFFILGYDSFSWVERWYHAEEVFENCILVPFIRGDGDIEALKKKAASLKESFRARIRPVTMEPPEISSTMIREKAARMESISGLVPEPVERYILDNGLYLKDGENR